MWLEGLLKYSKNYIPSTSENIKLVPLKYRDKKTLKKYGDIVLHMYNSFQMWHHEKDILIVRQVSKRLRPLFVTIEDLLNNIITNIDVELSVVLFEDIVIGFVSYYIKPNTCLYMLDVWIEPDYRNKGMFTVVHRILRRMATVLHCKYMDLEVLMNNKDSYCKYVTMGYIPYIGTYTQGISKERLKITDSLKDIFIPILLNQNNYKLYEKDIEFLWYKYHEYKILRFKLLGVDIMRNIPWDMKYVIQERLKAEVSWILFYLEKDPVGIITIVRSDLHVVAAAQINDFYFLEPYLENFIDIILRYIKEYIQSHLRNVVYFSTFAALSDNIKINAFEKNIMIHRADNLYLKI